MFITLYYNMVSLQWNKTEKKTVNIIIALSIYAVIVCIGILYKKLFQSSCDEYIKLLLYGVRFWGVNKFELCLVTIQIYLKRSKM